MDAQNLCTTQNFVTIMFDKARVRKLFINNILEFVSYTVLLYSRKLPSPMSSCNNTIYNTFNKIR